MIGEYLRLTPAELGSAIKDPGWALSYAEDVMDREEESAAETPPGEARYLTTYKAWNAIAFLLRRAGFPVDIVFGEEEFTEEDWGYGPARYLTPERVKIAAEALSSTSYDDLIRGVDPMELSAAEVYPLVWDEGPGALEWARGCYESLLPFFAAAARDGDAMLVWLD